MHRTLHHIALTTLAVTLLLPLFSQRALAQSGDEAAHMMGLQLAEARLDSTLDALQEMKVIQQPTLRKLCTTTCATGMNEQGEVRNYCASSCNDGTRETLVKRYRPFIYD